MSSTILSSSSLIHSSASLILLLIPSSVFFSYCIFHCVCSLYHLALRWTFLVSSWSVPPFFFQDFGSCLLSLHSILFQVDCLSPLSVFFFVVPSSGTYSSVIPLCLTFCLCSPIGYRVVIHFSSGVCPPGGWSWVLFLWRAGQWQRLCLEAALSSGRSPGEGNGNPLQYSCLENPMEGRSLVGYSPWGRKESDTESVTSLSSGKLEAACLLSRDMFPACLFFGLRHLSTGSFRLLGGASTWH